MSPSTKVFSILSVAAVLGQVMERQDNDKLTWRGEKLKEAAFKATSIYPFGALTKSKLKQIEKKNTEILDINGSFEITETLSFLIAALIDIRSHIKPERAVLIDPVLKRAKWSMMLFKNHSNDDLHERAFERYEKWAA